MNDFDFQLGHVKSNSRRLLGMQDRAPLSPSRGCFHYAYWRDKTSDLADARWQEAGAALGLLAHPDLHDDSLPPKEELLEAFLSAAAFWSKAQHRDGSFDEWYTNEHGFAATAFSLAAFGWTLHLLADAIPNDERRKILATAQRAGSWLLAHDDEVKANHQAAAAAALAVLFELTGDERFRRGAAAKHAWVLDGQTSEGWFREVGGMDLGYCGLLLDYMMLYHRLTRDEATVAAMGRLYAFLFPFIQNDLSVPAEAGICLNGYVSRLGTFLLAPYSAEAAAVATRLESQSAGFSGLRPYLSDDLRLVRWACLPALAAHFRKTLTEQARVAAAPREELPGPARLFFPEAGVFAQTSRRFQVAFLPAGGGVIRACFGDGHGRTEVFEDLGYAYGPIPGSSLIWSTGGYRSRRPAELCDDRMTCEAPFAPARFFQPSFAARLLLRAGCAVPGLWRPLRRWIDRYRLKNGTALNQSAAPISSGESGLTLRRTLFVTAEGLRIVDEFLRDEAGPVFEPRLLQPLLRGAGIAGVGPAEAVSGEGPRLCARLVKTVSFDSRGSGLRVERAAAGETVGPAMGLRPARASGIKS